MPEGAERRRERPEERGALARAAVDGESEGRVIVGLCSRFVAGVHSEGDVGCRERDVCGRVGEQFGPGVGEEEDWVQVPGLDLGSKLTDNTQR